MPGSIREPGSNVVAQYTVPIRGTWNSLAVHAIPSDALYDSRNVYLRKGWLRTRPGLSLYDSTVFTSPILGGAMSVTPTEKRAIAITTGKVYERGENDTWLVSESTLTYANSNNSRVDIAFIELADVLEKSYFGLIANEAYRLKAWNGIQHTTAQIVPASGSALIPFAKSVCIAGSRVVCLVAPHTIVWSKVLTIDNYPPLAYNKRAQTNDMGICVRALGSLGFVLYKERSIHPARVGGTNDETAFVFGEPIYVEGPAGVYAVVHVTGSPSYSGHVYMTRNGRIGLFNGNNYPQWIADGLWLFLQEDIDPLYAHMIFGVYDHRLHTIVFMYPRKGDGGMLKGMVLLCMPYEGTDLQMGHAIPAAFKGVTAKACSFACEVRWNQSIDRSLMFTNATNDCQSFTFDDGSTLDDGETYECMIQTPMSALPNAMHHDVTVQSFFQRGSGYGSVLLEAVTSNGLETEQGTIVDGKGKYVNLETDPVQEHEGFGVMTRFFGLRYTWNSANTVRYAGAMVNGRSIA